MRPVRLTVRGVGNSNVYPVDTYVSPANWGLALVITGTVNAYVQYTFDDVFAAGFTPSLATWFYHPSTPSGTPATANFNGNIAYPCTGVRLVLDTGTTGSATLTIIQAGGGGLS